jgi:gamma-glutamylcyclotransferase (GGCT)/AIG2-like uncharacterized protein YtfP
MSPSQAVFVYGTLMARGAMGHLLGDRPRRPGTTRGELWSLPAGYPALVLRGDGVVHGEWVDPVPDTLLGLLDVYEGTESGLYRRVTVQVTTAHARFPAWAWVMDHPETRGGRRLPGGRWAPFTPR